jgi:hypothetical protein
VATYGVWIAAAVEELGLALKRVCEEQEDGTYGPAHWFLTQHNESIGEFPSYEAGLAAIEAECQRLQTQ